MAVRLAQRVGNFGGVTKRLVKRQRPFRKAGGQRFALQQLHGDEVPAVNLVDVVNDADIGVIEGRGSLRFTLKPLQGVRILRQVVGQEFQRHQAAEPGVLGFIDDTHPAGPEFIQDAVMRDGLADYRVHPSLV